MDRVTFLRRVLADLDFTDWILYSLVFFIFLYFANFLNFLPHPHLLFWLYFFVYLFFLFRFHVSGDLH